MKSNEIKQILKEYWNNNVNYYFYFESVILHSDMGSECYFKVVYDEETNYFNVYDESIGGKNSLLGEINGKDLKNIEVDYKKLSMIFNNGDIYQFIQ